MYFYGSSQRSRFCCETLAEDLSGCQVIPDPRFKMARWRSPAISTGHGGHHGWNYCLWCLIELPFHLMVHTDNPTMRRIGRWMSSGGTSAEYWGNKFLELQKRQRCEGCFCAMSFVWFSMASISRLQRFGSSNKSSWGNRQFLFNPRLKTAWMNLHLASKQILSNRPVMWCTIFTKRRKWLGAKGN